MDEILRPHLRTEFQEDETVAYDGKYIDISGFPCRLLTGGHEVPFGHHTNTLQNKVYLLSRFVQDSRSGANAAVGRGQTHAARRKGLKEVLMAPASGTAFSMGQGALAGASVLGLGALAYYGLGLSNEVGSVDRAVLWPQEVKTRIRQVLFFKVECC